jgi:hypothetical protein
MKRITLIIGALSMLMCTTTSSYPQATLKLSNNSGKGRLLTANFTRSDVVSVAWKANGKVIFTSGSSAIGVTVAGGRCQGSAPDQLNNPNGVFVDKDNNIWVADASNGRVQKFANGSRDASTFGAEFPNAPSFPVNVFVNKNGDVYVAD